MSYRKASFADKRQQEWPVKLWPISHSQNDRVQILCEGVVDFNPQNLLLSFVPTSVNIFNLKRFTRTETLVSRSCNALFYSWEKQTNIKFSLLQYFFSRLYKDVASVDRIMSWLTRLLLSIFYWQSGAAATAKLAPIRLLLWRVPSSDFFYSSQRETQVELANTLRRVPYVTYISHRCMHVRIRR